MADELWQPASEGDVLAREHLMRLYRPLADKLARRYTAGTRELDDLRQVAIIGLLKAIDGFDLERGTAFTAYAIPTIRGELQRYLRDATWAVHVPRDLRDQVVRVRRAARELASQDDGAPTVTELAEATGLTLEEVVETIEADRADRPESLDAPIQVDGSGTTRGDLLGGADAGYDRTEDVLTLEAVMRALPERDRHVLALRFRHDLTQSEIGERIGLSQMQVSRILGQSLVRLRTIAINQRW
ncbi:MAG: SigB/SigF/SigG family RNA polymerase sigma factor [Solirubrobacteraceae bacterium]